MRKVVKHSMFVTNIQSLKLLLIWAIGNSFAWVELGLPVSPSRTYAELYHSLHRRRGNPFTTCQLFLRPTNIEKSAVSWRVPSKAYESLRKTDLPWNIELEPQKLSNVKAQGSLERPSTLPSKILTIRLIQPNDLDAIVNMCLEEYGSGPAYFPISNPLLLGQWIDRQYLRWLVEISSRMKFPDPQLLRANESSWNVTSDHAILVAALNDDNDGDRTLVGMVEISWQPINPLRTPQPFPIPMVVKQAMATMTTGSATLVGWITNLLIPSEYRGQGYSKVLVAACENVAAVWQCTTVHLHCDADPDTGRIPQRLYTSLGYRPPVPPRTVISSSSTSFTDRLSNQSSNKVVSYIVEIEGVPLMYLYKDI
jgi:GNAT superfamily N-acetyltransferase